MNPITPKPIALVFGATGGIGAALCRQLVANNWHVTLAAREPGRLSSLASQIGADSLVTDATDSPSVDRCFSQVVNQHGQIDAVAHCVGSLLLKPAHATMDADWRQIIETNLTSAFFVLRAAVKAMRSTGGSIVLVSSVAGRRGLANHEAIAAAKAGLIGLTLSAAATYARHQIRINCVAPGLVRTPLAEPILRSESALKYSTALHPLGRIGEPDEVASAIRWLMQPEQAWITGQVLGADGGLASVQSTVALEA
jgi:NAD(P)-dependent dehydrogenase (short-subunit alcohol dehydrogenase family)